MKPIANSSIAKTVAKPQSTNVQPAFHALIPIVAAINPNARSINTITSDAIICHLISSSPPLNCLATLDANLLSDKTLIRSYFSPECFAMVATFEWEDHVFKSSEL